MREGEKTTNCALDEKEAYVFFGAVASGKTTLSKIFEEQEEATIISQDAILHEKHINQRDFGTKLKLTERIKKRNESILQNPKKILVVDDMPSLPGRNGYIIDVIRKTHQEVTAVFFDLTEKTRSERFKKRLLLQAEMRQKIAKILQIKLPSEINDFLKLLLNPDLYHQIPVELKAEYDQFLQEFYLTGAHLYSKKKPDPIHYPGIDYVIKFQDEDVFDYSTLKQLPFLKIPFLRYLKEREKKPIQLCVWDIGNVLYEYTPYNLLSFIREHSTLKKPLNNFHIKTRKLFEDLMTSSIDFSTFSKNFCEIMGIPYSKCIEKELMKILKEGVRKKIEITQKTMLDLQKQGIQNALLSNAIPVLEKSLDFNEQLIPKELRFLSYHTGILKPEKKAWLQILEKTGTLPEDTLFIDDNRKNVLTGIRLKIASILFDQKTFEKDLAYQMPNTFFT